MVTVASTPFSVMAADILYGASDILVSVIDLFLYVNVLGPAAIQWIPVLGPISPASLPGFRV